MFGQQQQAQLKHPINSFPASSLPGMDPRLFAVYTGNISQATKGQNDSGLLKALQSQIHLQTLKGITPQQSFSAASQCTNPLPVSSQITNPQQISKVLESSPQQINVPLGYLFQQPNIMASNQLPIPRISPDISRKLRHIEDSSFPRDSLLGSHESLSSTIGNELLRPASLILLNQNQTFDTTFSQNIGTQSQRLTPSFQMNLPFQYGTSTPTQSTLHILSQLMENKQLGNTSSVIDHFKPQSIGINQIKTEELAGKIHHSNTNFRSETGVKDVDLSSVVTIPKHTNTLKKGESSEKVKVTNENSKSILEKKISLQGIKKSAEKPGHKLKKKIAEKEKARINKNSDIDDDTSLETYSSGDNKSNHDEEDNGAIQKKRKLLLYNPERTKVLEDYEIDLEATNTQDVIPTPVGPKHQTVIPNVGEIRPRKKELNCIWDPEECEEGVFEAYINALNKRLGGTIQNEEKAIKMFLKFGMDQKKILENLRKNKAYYSAILEVEGYEIKQQSDNI